MKILAIETSCDETAISIVECDGTWPKAHFSVLSNIVLSQAKLHAEYGGVFPSLAKREHARSLVPVLKKALDQAWGTDPPRALSSAVGGLSPLCLQKIQEILEREPELLKQSLEFILTIKRPQIDAIAVTYGPGLPPALWVGVNFAKALAYAWDLPIIPVNHMEGHLFSALLKKDEKIQDTRYKIQNIKLPVLALLISGGHTELVLMRDWFQYEIVGETKDDAVGEAFDKVARMLGLPYPGGPAISEQAQKWNIQDTRYKKRAGKESIVLPRPMIDSGDFNFSFSGLKTAVLYRVKKILELNPELIQEFSYEFQEATSDVLTSKTLAASMHYGAKTILVGGGVAANSRIREVLAEETSHRIQDAKLFYSPNELSGDNALMIAVAGYAHQSNATELHDMEKISADGGLRLS
jgi:N6-L-threonylcarbamoyladenine synthase